MRKNAAEGGGGDRGCGPVVENQGGAGRSWFRPDPAGEARHVSTGFGGDLDRG